MPTESRLPGLGEYRLATLKPREAMVACLLEADEPLAIEQVARYLEFEGFPLAYGLQTLRKAWRRDSIIREDSTGRLQLVPAAVLLDAWLFLCLSGATPSGSKEALADKLRERFRRHTRPRPARTIVARLKQKRFCWRESPDSPPRQGKLEEMLAELTPADLLVTDIAGVQAPCPILQIAATSEVVKTTLGRRASTKLDDLEDLYRYGCLQGYLLDGKKKNPVDWRNQDQPDVWETLYRLGKAPSVSFNLRHHGLVRVVRPLFGRDGTMPSVVLISSLDARIDIVVDEILNIT